MSQIKFSVIIPTYHRNDLLAKCLDCLAPDVQTLPAEQYEVIVTDDGSQTTAQEMIKQHYPWAKWVAGPRKGPAANRNNGAKYAQGEWLAFTDDDCLPSSGWLLAYSQAIMPGILVYEGKTTCEAGLKSPLEHAPINLTGGYLWSCNMMIQNKLFQDLRGFDEKFPYPHMEDVDLRERIRDINYSIKFVEASKIDHPPKKYFWGIKLAEMRESEFYFCYKRNNDITSVIKILHTIILARIRNIYLYKLSFDSITAFISLVIELLHMTIYITYWKSKYKNYSYVKNLPNNSQFSNNNLS